MSNTNIKNYIKSIKKIQPLIDAIESIPVDEHMLGNIGRMKMQIVMQTILCPLVYGVRSVSSYTSNVVDSFNERGFNFVPIDDSNHVEQWQSDVLDAYCEAVQANEPFADILTPLHALMINDGEARAKSQHFTPSHLADGATSLTHGALVKAVMDEPERVFKFMDTCCGAGALPLAFLRMVVKRKWKAERFHLIVNDIDPLGAAMTTTQIVSNQFIHGFQLRKFEVRVSDVIGEYMTDKSPVFVSCKFTEEEMQGYRKFIAASQT